MTHIVSVQWNDTKSYKKQWVKHSFVNSGSPFYSTLYVFSILTVSRMSDMRLSIRFIYFSTVQQDVDLLEIFFLENNLDQIWGMHLMWSQPLTTLGKVVYSESILRADVAIQRAVSRARHNLSSLCSCCCQSWRLHPPMTLSDICIIQLS